MPVFERNGISASSEQEWRSKARAASNSEHRRRRTRSVPTIAESQAADERHRVKLRADFPELTEAQINERVQARRGRIDAGHERILEQNEANRVASNEALKAKSLASHTAREFPLEKSTSIRHENLEMAHDREQARRREFERRLALSSTPFPFTQDEWIALCNRYDNKCLCCGSLDDLTIDHVHPVSRGGRNSIDNIQPLCRSCNSAKGTKHTDYRSA